MGVCRVSCGVGVGVGVSGGQGYFINRTLQRSIGRQILYWHTKWHVLSLRTNAPMGRVDRNWTEPRGQAA